MSRVYVVDNGGQWTHRIWRVLREIGCETRIIQNTTPVAQIDAEALILSGGALRIVWESPKLGSCIDYLREFKGPILGICGGLQLMAVHCGGESGRRRCLSTVQRRSGSLKRMILFRGLPKELSVWESHNDEVKEVKDFEVLAVSDNCAIQAMRHVKKPFYGVQFHPEVNNTEHGEEILKNFVAVAKG